jgi:hypothetical protein
MTYRQYEGRERERKRERKWRSKFTPLKLENCRKNYSYVFMFSNFEAWSSCE